VKTGNIDFASFNYAAKARLTAGQAVGTGMTKVTQLATEVFDYGGLFNPSNQRFEIAVKGLYFISSRLEFPPGSDNFHVVYRNGAEILRSSLRGVSSGGQYHGSLTASVEELQIGDYLEMYAMSPGGALTTGAGLSNYMSVCLVRPIL
jgi:hypothetical protein